VRKALATFAFALLLTLQACGYADQERPQVSTDVGDAQPSTAARIRAELEEQGVPVVSVTIDEQSGDLSVVMSQQKGEEPLSLWGQMLLQRRASLLKASGDLASHMYALQVIDSGGRVVLTTRQPIEPAPALPVGALPAEVVASVHGLLAAEVGQHQMEITNFNATADAVLGRVLEIEMDVDNSDLAAKESLAWVLQRLIPSLRDWTNESLKIDVYRLTVHEKGSNRRLLAYMIDANRHSVMAWADPALELPLGMSPPGTIQEPSSGP